MTYGVLPAAPSHSVAVVAQPSPSPTPGEPQGEDVGKSSPLGFLILILFFIAVAFLIRSMNKHLKRVPASFDKPEDESKPDQPQESKPNGKPDSA